MPFFYEIQVLAKFRYLYHESDFELFSFVGFTMAPRRRENHGGDDVNAPSHFEIMIDTDDLDTAFRANARRTMVPTRFFYVGALEALGLYEEVKTLFDNIGWGVLVTNSWRPYRGVTREVLTLMTIKHHGKSYPQTIDFQAKVGDYTLMMNEANDAFGAPRDGVYMKHPGFDVNAFWILNYVPEHQRYRCVYSKATMVRNLAFRIVLKLIAHTVLAKKENTNVTLTDLLIL